MKKNVNELKEEASLWKMQEEQNERNKDFLKLFSLSSEMINNVSDRLNGLWTLLQIILVILGLFGIAFILIFVKLFI